MMAHFLLQECWRGAREEIFLMGISTHYIPYTDLFNTTTIFRQDLYAFLRSNYFLVKK